LLQNSPGAVQKGTSADPTRGDGVELIHADFFFFLMKLKY